MDVLWFRLPRRRGEAEGALARAAGGGLLILVDRGERWQAGFAIPKGSYRELRGEGLDALRRRLALLAPELADRLHELRSWSDISLLQLASDRLTRWYVPGLLLIGDAAHVMSPVGGVGINYAIQDAVVAANVLAGPLLAGRVGLEHLCEVQRRRERPTRFIQALQGLLQTRLVAGALRATGPVRLPPLLRLLTRVPFVRDLPARLIALGPGRVRLER